MDKEDRNGANSQTELTPYEKYEAAVRYYTEQELNSHPKYRGMIEMVTNVLKSYDVFESFYVEQTGGMTMVPTFYLTDSRSISLTWDVCHWLMCEYDRDGECIWDSRLITEDHAELTIAQYAMGIARGSRIGRIEPPKED